MNTTTLVRLAGPGRWARQVTIALLFLIGGALVVKASWIEAKAWLAQRLLENAWQRRQSGASHAKPWPWADTQPVARLRFVDEGGATFIVLSGASGRTLAFAPGHIDGTALPGTTGNIGIAGHRDTHFRVLREVSPGDRVELETPDGERVTYLVRSTAIADQRETHFLHDDADRLTLVTCYPFDAIRPGGTLRWVVIADRKGGSNRQFVRDGSGRFIGQSTVKGGRHAETVQDGHRIRG